MEKSAVFDFRRNIQKYVPVVLVVVLVLILTIANRNFLTPQSIYNLLAQVSALGFVALGAYLVILTAGIDFCGGYGLSLAGVTAGALYMVVPAAGFTLVFGSVLIGALVGLTNGLIIVLLGLNPFITTLATMSICEGVSMIISQGRQVKITTGWVLAIGNGKVFGIFPVCFLMFLAAVIIMSVVMTRTKFGIYTYALGGNREAVEYAGINKKLYEVLVYVMAGVFYGIAAVITCAQVTVVTTNISGDFLLDGIASAVVGGTSLSGGKGRVIGVFFGAFIINMITTLLNFLKVPFLLRTVIKGLIILAILIFEVGIERAAARAVNK